MKSVRFLAVLSLLAGLTWPVGSRAAISLGDSALCDLFADWQYSYHKNDLGNDNHLRQGRFWLNGSKMMADKMSYASMSLALEDKAFTVKELSLNYYHVPRPIDHIIIGRFSPPFAREWSELDPDELPTINYSGIFDQLVYRDDGVEVDVSGPDSQFFLGAFMGERDGGVVRERQDGKVHLYVQSIITLLPSLDISGSYRWSRTRNNLWAASARWQKNDKEEVSGEAVGFGQDVQWYGKYSILIIPNFLAMVRYENLKHAPDKTTIGLKVEHDNLDLKIESAFGQGLPRVVLGQLLVHLK